MLNHYKQILDSIRQISLRNYNTEYLLSLCTTIIGTLCDLFTIFIGVVGIQNNTISIGVFVVILNSVVSIRSLVMTLVSSNVYIQQFFVSLRRVLEIINIQEESSMGLIISKETNIVNSVQYTEKESIRDITFRNVGFLYDKENVILDGVDITFQKGKVNVVSGESGSGKSTIVALLLQLYQPTVGDILVNGRNLAAFGQLRDKVSVCFQTDYFLNGSVLDNLKSVNPAKSDEEISKVLQLVEVDEFVGKLSDGWGTNIGEVSKNFSGGELKRISLARTLLKEAQVYVFDESFANVDAQMRTRVFDNIVTYLKDKMLIVVTHDQALTSKYDTVHITV